jgi:hypothetical protein
MSISNLPLQDMITSVVRTATQKLASERSTSNRIKAAASATECDRCGYSMDDCQCEEPSKLAQRKTKTASPGNKLTEKSYVTKLASVCDFIAQNVDNITVPNRGVLGSVLAKVAEDGLPEDHGEPVPPTNPAGALETTTGMEGTQEYKKDKPKGTDAAASEADSPLSDAGMPGGKTQLENNMHTAPGQESGSVPSATYPTDGPFHSGPSKTAGKIGNLIGKAGGKAGKGVPPPKGKKTKTAAEMARELILNKLAGEDVLSANISSPKDGGPLVGDGELKVLRSDESASNPNEGSGYGNDTRKLIESTEAAINYTKGDAKKPQGKQMSEVLSEPAFSPEHDSKLREQLRNSGEAGVKIAGAAAVSFLKQAAAKGVLTQETVDAFKAKTKTASEAPVASGGGGDRSGDAIAKLKSLMAQQKGKASMGDGNC